MNIVFESMSGIDEEFIELAAMGVMRCRRRKRALKAVKYTAIAAAAAAACIAAPFAVNKWGELMQNAPQPPLSGTEIATSAAVPWDPAAQTYTGEDGAARCTKLFDYFNVIKATLPEDRHLTFFEPDGLPEHVLKWDFENIWDVSGGEEKLLYSGMPVWSLYLADITGDGMDDLCSTVSSGSGVIDERVYVYDLAESALYELQSRGVTDYALIEMNGGLYYRAYDYPLGGDRNEFRIQPLKMWNLVNTANYADEPAPDRETLPPEKIFDYGTWDHTPDVFDTDFTMEEFPDFRFECMNDGLWIGADIGGKQRRMFNAIFTSVYLADITGDGYREICSVVRNGGREAVYVYDVSDDTLWEYVSSDSLIPAEKIDHYELYITAGTLFVKGISDEAGPVPAEELHISSLKRADAPSGLTPEKIFDYGTAENTPAILDADFTMEEFPDFRFECMNNGLFMGAGIGGKQKRVFDAIFTSVYLADITGDGYRDVCTVADCGRETVYVYDISNDTLWEYVNDGSLIPAENTERYELYIVADMLYVKIVSAKTGAALTERLQMNRLQKAQRVETLAAYYPSDLSFKYAENALSQIPEDAAKVFCRAYYMADQIAFTSTLHADGRKPDTLTVNGVTYCSTGYDYMSFVNAAYMIFTGDAAGEMFRIFPYFTNKDGELYVIETVGCGVQETKTEFSVEEITDDRITLLRTVYYYVAEETRDVLTDVDYTHFTLHKSPISNRWRADVFLQAVPEGYDAGKYKAAPPPIEMSDAQLRAILDDRGTRALEMYALAYFGGTGTHGYGDKEYPVDTLDNWSVYSLPDGYYFRTKDEMREYLKEYFVDETVSEYMSRVAEGSMDGEMITAERRPGVLFNVDGELFVYPVPKSGPMYPNFENAFVEGILGNEVTFRTEYVVEDDPYAFETPGTYIFRGIMRYTDGRWKFVFPMTAERVDS